MERFKDLLSGNEGFTLTASMAQFLDHGSLALGIDIGKELCGMARHLIEEELNKNIADYRFSPHLTLFTGNKMGETERKQLSASFAHVKTGAFVCDNVTLRSTKKMTQPQVWKYVHAYSELSRQLCERASCCVGENEGSIAVKLRDRNHAGPAILDHTDCGDFGNQGFCIRHEFKTRLIPTKGWSPKPKYRLVFV